MNLKTSLTQSRNPVYKLFARIITIYRYIHAHNRFAQLLQSTSHLALHELVLAWFINKSNGLNGKMYQIEQECIDRVEADNRNLIVQQTQIERQLQVAANDCWGQAAKLSWGMQHHPAGVKKGPGPCECTGVECQPPLPNPGYALGTGTARYRYIIRYGVRTPSPPSPRGKF